MAVSKVLITSNRFNTTVSQSLAYINDLTREMDKHLNQQIKNLKNPIFHSYIYNSKVQKNVMLLRFPGATRGYIEVDSSLLITKIVLYEGEHGISGIYNDTIIEAVKPFIGRKIQFESIVDINRMTSS